MKPRQSQQLKWELFRERFGIADRFPPPQQRPEKTIGDILTAITPSETVRHAPLPRELLEGWPVAAGPQLAKHTSPAHINDGILYVYADHPGWLGELKRLPKTHLLKRIGTACPSAGIREIRFQMDPAVRTQKNRPYPAGKNQTGNPKKQTGEP